MVGREKVWRGLGMLCQLRLVFAQVQGVCRCV